MMNLEMPDELFDADVGKADLFTGKSYEIPYFFEHPGHKMMKDPSKSNHISFKTWKGEIFQFSLDQFHSHGCLLVTSTLKDCAFFPQQKLSIDKAVERAERAINTKTPVKNSFSGYSTYGKKMLTQYRTLIKHLKEQEIYFSDETLTAIYKELKRRAKYE